MDEMICYCSNVYKKDIIKALANGASTLLEIKEVTKACTKAQCHLYNPTKQCCSSAILKIINEYNATKGFT
ncbi:MAG: (2Fe-2S)-binding protein [Bacilli bacterium]